VASYMKRARIGYCFPLLWATRRLINVFLSSWGNSLLKNTSFSALELMSEGIEPESDEGVAADITGLASMSLEVEYDDGGGLQRYEICIHIVAFFLFIEKQEEIWVIKY
jgi:hypothetical protein